MLQGMLTSQQTTCLTSSLAHGTLSPTIMTQDSLEGLGDPGHIAGGHKPLMVRGTDGQGSTLYNNKGRVMWAARQNDATDEEMAVVLAIAMQVGLPCNVCPCSKQQERPQECHPSSLLHDVARHIGLMLSSSGALLVDACCQALSDHLECPCVR